MNAQCIFNIFWKKFVYKFVINIENICTKKNSTCENRKCLRNVGMLQDYNSDLLHFILALCFLIDSSAAS